MSSTCRVIVGLSGGVDSAVSALLLRERGHEVQGLFMSNWDESDELSYCTASQDFQDARAVAAELGIPLHRASFAREYRARVFEHFLAEQRCGRTGNPDVLCNREIKFGVALAWARRLGARYFATGHYARLVTGPAGIELHKARDAAKDQSYFLHAVDRQALASTLMPLGELTKGEVRARARRAGLPVHDKPDSTGICFIGERPFRDFIARFLPPLPGPIETPAGERLGTHEGLAGFTLGQRAGLGLGGRRGCAELPWYVAAKDLARNALIVVQGADHPALMSGALSSGPMHWLGPAPAAPIECTVKVRYRQADQPARLLPRPDGTARILFGSPQRAVTPGQYVVAYAGERCLGGGLIEAAEPAQALAA